uniref:G protein-coupled receptor n=1 Tax=Panagrolaimus superbus TaxID=310955 RepID=A0A914YD89_9BILA
MLSSLPTVSKVQKQMTIQAICVCGEMLFAPLLHIFMLFWEFPVIVEIIAHFGWICLHGDTPIIYFLLNISLRKAVKDMLTPVFAMIKPIIPTSLNKISQNPVYSVSRGTVHAGDNNYVNSI